jgi:hypothetical protein
MQVLTTLQVNSLFYYNRSPVSRALFGGHRIKATLAGAAPPHLCSGVMVFQRKHRLCSLCNMFSKPFGLPQHLRPHAGWLQGALSDRERFIRVVWCACCGSKARSSAQCPVCSLL